MTIEEVILSVVEKHQNVIDESDREIAIMESLSLYYDKDSHCEGYELLQEFKPDGKMNLTEFEETLITAESLSVVKKMFEGFKKGKRLKSYLDLSKFLMETQS